MKAADIVPAANKPSSTSKRKSKEKSFTHETIETKTKTPYNYDMIDRKSRASEKKTKSIISFDLPERKPKISLHEIAEKISKSPSFVDTSTKKPRKISHSINLQKMIFDDKVDKKNPTKPERKQKLASKSDETSILMPKSKTTVSSRKPSGFIATDKMSMINSHILQNMKHESPHLDRKGSSSSTDSNDSSISAELVVNRTGLKPKKKSIIISVKNAKKTISTKKKKVKISNTITTDLNSHSESSNYSRLF